MHVGFFVETPLASIDFNIPSTSKGKGRRSDSKGKNPKKQKERKDVVTKYIRSLFRGPTSVKSSGSFLFLFFLYTTINLHFTSRKNIDNEKTQTNKITRSPDTNIPESTWEYKITNNNNKYICKTENWRL